MGMPSIGISVLPGNLFEVNLASTIATITGNIKVNSAGNKNTALRFDLEKFLTMQ